MKLEFPSTYYPNHAHLIVLNEVHKGADVLWFVVSRDDDALAVSISVDNAVALANAILESVEEIPVGSRYRLKGGAGG